ncbi:hypothetical protein DFH09DRAFT_1106742 [Mycena vulgaris]|nr:hypothetical protein DFH09DRAFT_1106742 [Mycena vulgaris]
MYAQKQSEAGVFIVPKNKDDLRVLVEQWSLWGPTLLPGGRVAPVATHCFLQVDGVPFAGAGTLEDLGREFETRNPPLGLVVRVLTWVNKPPSKVKVVALAAAGRKSPKAKSLFIHLQSHEMVDKAVAGGRVVLASTAPAVGRGFPHLCVVQCWGCLKYGHMRACCSSVATCGGCGKDSYGTICAEKPVCLNCEGPHHADSYTCPVRKRIAEQLRARAAELCKVLDSQSRFSCLQPVSKTLSPLSSVFGLAELPSPSTPLASRLPKGRTTLTSSGFKNHGKRKLIHSTTLATFSLPPNATLDTAYPFTFVKPRSRCPTSASSRFIYVSGPTSD